MSNENQRRPGCLVQPNPLGDGPATSAPTRRKLEITIELDEEALVGKIGHKWRNTESYDEHDGSVVDW